MRPYEIEKWGNIFRLCKDISQSACMKLIVVKPVLFHCCIYLYFTGNCRKHDRRKRGCTYRIVNYQPIGMHNWNLGLRRVFVHIYQRARDEKYMKSLLSRCLLLKYLYSNSNIVDLPNLRIREKEMAVPQKRKGQFCVAQKYLCLDLLVNITVTEDRDQN